MDATTESLEERVAGEDEEGSYVVIDSCELGREGEGLALGLELGLARGHLEWLDCDRYKKFPRCEGGIFRSFPWRGEMLWLDSITSVLAAPKRLGASVELVKSTRDATCCPAPTTRPTSSHSLPPSSQTLLHPSLQSSPPPAAMSTITSAALQSSQP